MPSIVQRLIAVIALAVAIPAAADSLAEQFRQPPDTAKPRIWWFWGESVTTDAGITKDLEAMHRVGIGGVVIYEQVFTDRPDALKSLSPQWLERVKFASAECARLGMSLEINSSSGYVAGGPWITPALGMQRLVSSETIVDGGKPLTVALPQPPTRLDYYKDVAVLACPTPAGGGDSVAALQPKVSSNVAGFDATELFYPKDSARPASVRIKPRADGEPVLIMLDYGQATTVRSISYTLRRNTKALVIATQLPRPFPWKDDFYGQNMQISPIIGQLEASADGQTWRKLCDLPPVGYLHDSWYRQTVSFPATTAQWVRLNLHDWGHNYSANDDDLVLTSVEVSGEARIDQWEKKSGNVVDLPQRDRTPAYANSEVIDPARVLDLTSAMDADGTLRWNAPAGRWTILRIGHTPTGAKTKHGRPETMGLECDKLSEQAARVQFDHYVKPILTAVRSEPGGRIAGVQMDSAEHGSQNWTPLFREEFKQLRGYDLLPYLPAMFGHVVSTPQRSDRFLYDVRRTIADLMSQRYYGTFRRLCQAEGMVLSAEAPGIATCLPSDNFQAKGQSDVPMGEFWMTQPEGTIDCLEAAMAAHVYGKPIAAAEAFTGSKAESHPAMMKPLADAAMALGINRFYVLAYVHQPWDDRVPGVAEDRFFLPYQRHNTWWEQSGAFWQTLSRSCTLLQQGKPTADLLYHLGNDTPLKITTFTTRPVPPAGYSFDACGDEGLLERLDVKDGRFVLPDGMSYRILVLAGGEHMTLSALRKLEALVAKGGIILGSPPTGMPGFLDGESGAADFSRITDALWGAAATWKDQPGDRNHGQGRVLWNISPAEALAKMGIAPDFEFRSTDGNPIDLLWNHRRGEDSDDYFIANHLPQPAAAEATFRITGKTAELWYPETGEIVPAARGREVDGRTVIPIKLEPLESVFVHFRDPAPSDNRTLPAARVLVHEMPVQREITGPWTISFEPERGAPPSVTIDKLQSWTQHPDPGVQHFSGTATYRKDVDLHDLPPGQRLVLDLGRVEQLAQVRVNGRDLGVLWKAPYAVDITDAVHTGSNRLEVSVTNIWMNRLIADAALPESQRVTWTTFNPYSRNDKLAESGLLGPVRVRSAPAAKP
jgi:hypothetical protein